MEDVNSYAITKIIQVHLHKENDSFGFTLWGGNSFDRLKSCPLVIRNIIDGGPAYRDGTIKSGDRLLAIDNINLSNASIDDAVGLLNQIQSDAIFTIEYDILVVDAVENAYGPLLVELKKTQGLQLGISLANSHVEPNTIIIESIKQASIAERCGALHVNDQLLAVNDTSVEKLSLKEVAELLTLSVGEHLKLEILPLGQLYLKQVPDSGVMKVYPPMTSYETLLTSGSSCSTIISPSSWINSSYNLHHKSINYSQVSSSNMSLTSPYTNTQSPTQVSHPETTDVTINVHHHSFGFALQTVPFNNLNGTAHVIGNIDPDGPAARTGVIQVGDRVLGVNGQSTQHLMVEEVTETILESKPTVKLQIEFDVMDSVTLNSGTFIVKLAKTSAGLGLTITTSRQNHSADCLIISEVRRGSIAYRTGTIHSGDHLLAINGVKMDNCTPEDAAHILQTCGSIVKLHIRKGALDEEVFDGLVYSVELIRHGGPLGLTISGSEDALDPIMITSLTPGGLAEKTGALHVADRILAINGQSLLQKPLSEAIMILQNSGDTIILKITKSSSSSPSTNTKTDQETTYQKRTTPLPSTDSAVESWDGDINDVSDKYYSTNANKTDAKGQVATKTLPRKTIEDVENSSTSNWDDNSDNSRDSSGITTEDQEWANMIDKFEACSQQLNDLCLKTTNNQQYEVKNSSTETIQQTNNIENYPSFMTKSFEQSLALPVPVELHTVALFKDKVYEDFGFSVSDGVFEHGVYVNRIRPDGPADLSGILQPCDRILQVDGTNTYDYDCCLTVPLMAAAGDRIELVIARTPSNIRRHLTNANILPWLQDGVSNSNNKSFQKSSICSSNSSVTHK